MKEIIQNKRGSEKNLKDITLEDGELAFTKDTRKLYIGLNGKKVCVGDSKYKSIIIIQILLQILFIILLLRLSF